MSRPVRRGPLLMGLNDLRHGTSNEAQCNINVPSSKSQHQHSTIVRPGPPSEVQNTLCLNDSGSSDRSSEFIAANCEITGHDDSYWNPELHNSIPNLPLSYIGPSEFIVPDAQLSAMLNSNFGSSPLSINQSGFHVGIESNSFPHFFTSHQNTPSSLQAQKVENIDPSNSHSTVVNLNRDLAEGFQTLNHFHNGFNHPDWLNELLDEAAKSPSRSDTTPLDNIPFLVPIALTDGNLENAQVHANLTHAQPQKSIAPHIDRSHKTDHGPQLNNQKRTYRKIRPLSDEKDQAVANGKALTPEIIRYPKRHYSKPLNAKGHPNLGRYKPLDSETAKAAAEMRILKACLRCRIMKVSCTPGKICNRCLESASAIERNLCIRYNLELYTELLFPPIVNSNFLKSTVENLMQQNVAGFQDKKISVQISSGPTYPPISLWVHEFQPLDEDFLALPHVKTDKNGKIGTQFMLGYALPLALSTASCKNLREKCQEHVDLIAEGPRCRGELLYKHTSIVPWEVYNAIHRYQKSTNDEIVGKAIKLYAMHFFLTQILLLTDESAKNAINQLRRPTKHLYTPALTSKLISLQVKQEMYNLAHNTTGFLLRDLEEAMLKNGKSNRAWASSFCVVLILCMCVETIQVATDFKVVYSMREDDGDSKIFREESRNLCQHLDEHLVSTWEKMFHRAFRSYKPLGSRKNERGFNPIRDEFVTNNADGLDEAIVKLVAEIRKVIREQEEEIGLRLERPSFDYNADDLSDLMSRHLVFRERNSGRLVSRFLRSFFQQSS